MGQVTKHQTAKAVASVGCGGVHVSASGEHEPASFEEPRLLGDHPVMLRLRELVTKVARSRATVLLQGESGTGKELVAEAIHRSSRRRRGPLIKLNCAALNEGVLESELFGHERGAFTGATGRRRGRFEQAHEGTLFLDEVSEIPAPLQVKLLRFLQERRFERVGGDDTVSVDVRIVAATHRDLLSCVKAGRFREDLFFRINVIQLDIPPLRSRRSDIPLLARHFLQRVARENHLEIAGFSDEALDELTAYAWPGNVRELQNAVERATVLAQTPSIQARDLALSSPRSRDIDSLIPGASMLELERIAILRTLEAVGGSTARTAELLGISQRKVQYRLKQWGLRPEVPAVHHGDDRPVQ